MFTIFIFSRRITRPSNRFANRWVFRSSKLAALILPLKIRSESATGHELCQARRRWARTIIQSRSQYRTWRFTRTMPVEYFLHSRSYFLRNGVWQGDAKHVGATFPLGNTKFQLHAAGKPLLAHDMLRTVIAS